MTKLDHFVLEFKLGTVLPSVYSVQNPYSPTRLQYTHPQTLPELALSKVIIVQSNGNIF